MDLVTPVQPIQLVITLDRSTGGITVGGPVDDLLFCFGLLECAKQSLIAHQQQKDQRITPAVLMPPGMRS